MVPWQTGEEKITVAFPAAVLVVLVGLVGLVFLAVVIREGFLVVTGEVQVFLEEEVLEAPAEGAVVTRN
jgi:NAD/NADP transhydrogenase alpha subunit